MPKAHNRKGNGIIMIKNMRRMKDIRDISAANARYIIRRIFAAYGEQKPNDSEINLDGCSVMDYPHGGMCEWVRVSITAEVRGTLYRFGIDLAQAPCSNSTMCCNMFMSE